MLEGEDEGHAVFRRVPGNSQGWNYSISKDTARMPSRVLPCFAHAVLQGKESVQELMNRIQEAMSKFKSKQRARYQELQQASDLHERSLEMFLERMGTPAWSEAANLPAPAVDTAGEQELPARPQTAQTSGRAPLVRRLAFLVPSCRAAHSRAGELLE